MDKALKYILYIILIITVVCLISTVFSNTSISKMRKTLEAANRSADSALNELRFSKSKIDSIRSDMNVLQNYVQNIQRYVDLNDAKKSLEEKNSEEVKKALRKRIDSLRGIINNDPELPVIPEPIPLKQH